MYVVAGASGQVGCATARALIQAGRPIRAMVVSEAERSEWLDARQEAVAVDFYRKDSIVAPLTDVTAVFLMIPPNYDAQADYAEARQIIDSFAHAIRICRPHRVICLSSIGAHRTHGLGIIQQSRILEDELGSMDLPISFVRPAWFMENAAWQLPLADRDGAFESFLWPLERRIPMTATADIGNTIADLMMSDTSNERRVVEIEGPQGYSPLDVAREMSNLLGRAVEAKPVPRENWHLKLAQEGSANPSERMAMLDGFNSGWIDFEGPPCEKRTGSTPLTDVLAHLIHRYRTSI
ncbi:NmrA family NAD(P)-binding protein [Bradyrhizobium sp. 187]|uniref:NmrA family NAD(P)-binding protein n=1 Tax=Bradyrhizobium sp. 187 TaxID=2782655 RepID=UPI001FFF258D|nr:NmrA family NAD(P)-binding protein [Bradyrhizobium sp. 187]UPJ71855.1 NmrA family NAD(P)-binding protein [Bradyrhizobium sp. 187]